MSGSLWQELDAAIAIHIWAQMGEMSGYPDLQVVAVEVGDTWHPDATPKPGALIVSNNADLNSAGHGPGGPHYAVTYEYMIVVYAETAAYTEAKQAAQTLHARLIAAMRQWPDVLAAAQAATTTGETADRLRMDRSRIEIRGRQDASPGPRLGIAVLRFEIDTMN